MRHVSFKNSQVQWQLLLACYILLAQATVTGLQSSFMYKQRRSAVLGAEMLHKMLFIEPSSTKRRTSKLPMIERTIDDEKESNSQYNEQGQEFRFADHLSRALDLVPLLRGVASHAGTRRGRQGLLALVNEDSDNIYAHLLLDSYTGKVRAKRRRATDIQFNPTRSTADISRSEIILAPIADSAESARKEYERVEQASLAIRNDIPKLTHPPFYGAESSPLDSSTIADTDNDEWLPLPLDVWTLENIIQAEQVIDTLLKVKEWGMNEESQTWIPLLSEISSSIDKDEDLPSLYDEIAGTVEIVRVRSVTDPSGKSSFVFRFKGDKFPILRLLQEKEAKLLERGAKEMDKGLMGIQNEIKNVERQIQEGLVYRIMSVSGIIDEGMNIMARLDVLFAKAAFGLKLNGVVPKVSNEGRIDVDKFVHPVLAVRDDPAYFSSGEDPAGVVVPTDLHLSSEEGDRALIISGPNGGGKTLAMKSFGMICILCKIGISIPVLHSEKAPRVDYFDRILVEVGDQQSVEEGESTWTAKLNACASIIESISAENPDSSKKDSACLVLLDELGSGTDPEAGGAIAQAILEQLMSVHSCRIVATTHSPRLKALSYESSDFGCATVLLKRDTSSEYRLPTFQLEYGSIGDSYAMGAASRCKPKLPEALLSRAGELMAKEGSESGAGNGGYIRALTDSMEKQVDKAREARTATEVSAHDSAKCRLAMMSLAAAYDLRLAMWEQRLEGCYQSLKDQKLDQLELVGETIAELRVVKKQMQSEKERLGKRGLRLLPNSYKLAVGESVVIVAEGEWDGVTAKIVADSTQDGTLKPTEVLVQPSGSSFSPLDDLFPAAYNPIVEKPIVFLRHELAIWDYDSVWDYRTTEIRTTSVLDSKRKLSSLLSTLKTLPTNKTEAKPGPEQSFTSSRGRKSAGKEKKKRK